MAILNKDEFYLKQHRIIAVRNSVELSQKHGINIYQSALYRLYNDGFKDKDKGTDYIAKLILQLYHERSLLEKYYKRDSYQGYWDLSDPKNAHYNLMGNPRGKLLNVKRAIEANPYENENYDINELIYDLTDLEIKEYCEDGRDREEQPSYKKLLLK